MSEKELLTVSNLKMYYPVRERNKGGIFAKKQYVKAVDGVSFTVCEGQTFGIVGESGCGKTTTGKMIVKLLTPSEGSILYEGKDIFRLSRKDQAEMKKKIQIIFQDPYSSLDPRFTCGRLIAEPLAIHRIGGADARREKVLELMADVGLGSDVYGRFPHEFSGGQRQRIGVARALALNPSLIVCDEPVSALDVSIQAKILNLMQSLQDKYHLTYIFISHNLSVVKHFCDRIAVMYLGKIVELADKNQLFRNFRHPYTDALFDAIPIPDPDQKSMRNVLEGDIPSPLNPPSGCVFHTRCRHCGEICETRPPLLREIEPGHLVACHVFGNH
ncbi:MAG: ATP-binding cassette domain-containing protein [Peptococcaceae bacterium]|nr:ATP-binding cassette domain-containing protein [Peptococcaceae bacterium]